MIRGSSLPSLLLLVSIPSCGPDKRPQAPCDGPSFNLVVRAEDGPLPPDTRINVRYGSNQDGEPYQLGQQASPQAVFCEEDTSTGGAPSSAGGAGGEVSETTAEPAGVQALRCRLYTQGPARLDVTATGYEPIERQDLSFDTRDHCQIEVDVKLVRLLPDAGT